MAKTTTAITIRVPHALKAALETAHAESYVDHRVSKQPWMVFGWAHWVSMSRKERVAAMRQLSDPARAAEQGDVK